MNRISFNFRTSLFLTLFISLLYPVKGQVQVNQTVQDKISLLFIGDIMGHDEQIWSAENR